MSNLNLHPLFRRSIGFDRLNDFIDYAMQSDAPNYPPYNIEKAGENRYRIVVATAGFSLEELGLSLENQLLTISGKPEVVQKETTEYLHKGIARRAFKLSLRLMNILKFNKLIMRMVYWSLTWNESYQKRNFHAKSQLVRKNFYLISLILQKKL